MHHLRLPLTLFAAVSMAPGQNELYVPASYQLSDAPSLGRWPGFTQRTRTQILIGANHLLGARGRTLTSVAVRRDGSYQAALTSGATDLTLLLTPARSADDPSAHFASNRTNTPTSVFVGRINLPASPALTSSNQPNWQAPYAVAVPFTQGYAYTQGDLCLEAEGVPVADNTSPWWPIDYALDAGTGAAQIIGSGCGRFSRASTAGAQWQVGGTARLLASGEAGSMAVSMLGLHTNLTIDMSFLGATGCTLRVDPVVSFMFPYIGGADPRQPGIAELQLEIPNQESLLGASVGAQWLDLQQFLPPQRWSNAAGLTLSNALSLTFSTAAGGLHGATIEAGVYPTGAMPDDGHVTPRRLPVMQFSAQ